MGEGGEGGEGGEDDSLRTTLGIYICYCDVTYYTLYSVIHIAIHTNIPTHTHTHLTHTPTHPKRIQPNHPSTHLTPSIHPIHPPTPPAPTHRRREPPVPLRRRRRRKAIILATTAGGRIPSISFALSSSSSSCFCLGNRRHFHRQPLFAERMKTKRRFSCAARLKIKRAQRQNSSRGMTKRGGLR